MFAPLRRLRHLPRYRRIVGVLARHGFGSVLESLQVHERLHLPRRFLHPAPTGVGLSPAEHLRLALEELGPTFIKLGQILSTRPDLLPPDYITELSKLQDTAPPLPWDAVRQVIADAWGCPPEERLAAIETVPLAAASLAQVHAATLPDGTPVVVKVQRPAIWDTIQVDLEILHDLAYLAQRTPLGELYDLVAIAEDFAFTLRNELDYRREGHNADRFRRNFAGHPHLRIPQVYWELTTSRVLVLERIQGVKIDDLDGLTAAGLDRRRVALHAAQIVVKEVLEDGFFHADPHPGNFVVLPGEVIGAMDFGMVGHLSDAVRLDLIRLYIVSVRLDEQRIVDQLIRMGAVGTAVDRRALGQDLHRLLTRYHGLPLKDIRAREVIRDILPIAFRHRLRLPAELWLLGKTLMMLEGVGLQLDPDFDFFAVSEPFVARLMRRLWWPGTWAPALLADLDAWWDLWHEMPRAGVQLLSRLERGEAPIQLLTRPEESYLRHLDRLITRLALSILISAFIIGLALLVPAVVQSPYLLALVVLGFLIVSGLGVWWGITILRH